jgi:hypothetical protein
MGAGLAYRYDARRDETIWTVYGQPIGLTVGRIGVTRAYYLAEQMASAAAAVPGQLATGGANDYGRNA